MSQLLVVADNSQNTPAQLATSPTARSPVSDHRCASIFKHISLVFDLRTFVLCTFEKAHNRCSETFYKKEIETEIHAEPSKNAQERQKMMDLLKKFEEESVADQTLLEEDEGEGPSDLVRRFEAVDLGRCLPQLPFIFTLR